MVIMADKNVQFLLVVMVVKKGQFWVFILNDG